jgi:diacylglycerol O-acyltransferase
MERLSSQDASFLHLEDAVNHMHIGSVALFEGPPPTYAALSRMLRAHLTSVPRYRQRVHFTPLALGRPVWVDDPHFNLDYHLRRTALPEPGGDEELRTLVGRVMSQQLDRHKPLWETWVIEGLGDGRWALLTKVHHCMVDGVSGTDLLTVILDKEREPESSRPQAWRAEVGPSGMRLLADALVERSVSPYEAVRSVRAGLRAPRQLATRIEETTRALIGMRGLVRRARSSPM